MPPFTLQPGEIDRRGGVHPRRVRSSGPSIEIGTAARGKAIVEGKGGVPVVPPHRTASARAWRRISATSAWRARADALHRSLADPSSAMMPINRPVRIAMKDGRTITGRRLNEDTYTVQLIDDKERLHSIAKSDIRSYVVETKSTDAVVCRHG